MSVPTTRPHPRTKPPTSASARIFSLLGLAGLAATKRSFDHADIVLPNALGDIGHLHSRQNGLVKRAVGFNFTNESIVRDCDLVELQRRLLLLLKRGCQA